MDKPKIRFKGYTDAWEQRKLNEIFKERNEQYPVNEDYPLMAFIANVGVAPKGERYDRSALINDEQGKKYKRTELGDFIYSSNNLETGSIGLNNYGNASVSPVYSIFKSKNNSDSDFLGRVLLRKEFINAMVKYRQGVVYGQWKIHESDFLNLDIAVPSLDEQRMIGTYFNKIDTLITLHQRKCEEVKKLKKYMLQNMFPRNGSNVPEIRFDGFTNAWEQRKLGDCCDMYNGDRSSKYPNADDMVSDGIPFINAGDLENGTVNLMTCNRITREKYNDLGGAKLQRGDIVYCLRGTLGKNAFIDNFDEGTVASSLVALRPKNIGGKYLHFIINSDIEYRQRIVRNEGAAQPNLSAKSVSEYIIPVPSEAEQQQISAYFSRLDTLITLHQRKCEKLQNIKKFMLQNMFV